LPITIEEIQRLFTQEFISLLEKFSVLVLAADEVGKSNKEYIWHPGVYVWWHPEIGALKVGRHFTNSRKRALEHVNDNTGEKLRDYGGKPDTKLTLFNVENPDDYHWVAAVEVYLEKNTSPLVRSKRQG